MGSTPVQSQIQGRVDSSPELYAKGMNLNVMMPLVVAPTIPTNGEFLKDGSRIILRLAKDSDDAGRWLKQYVGLDVAVGMPHLGLWWTSRLSERRLQKYIYVRVPANLRKYVLSFWRSGVTVPVIVMVPPIVLAAEASRVVGNGQ
jgi:hypothetical protein